MRWTIGLLVLWALPKTLPKIHLLGNVQLVEILSVFDQVTQVTRVTLVSLYHFSDLSHPERLQLNNLGNLGNLGNSHMETALPKPFPRLPQIPLLTCTRRAMSSIWASHIAMRSSRPALWHQKFPLRPSVSADFPYGL